MAHTDVSTFSRRLTIFIGLLVVSAMAFGLAISFYRNILFEETLRELSERNRLLRDGIDDGLRELAYYRSHQYRDKYAKENLGKLNAGESVLILTEEHELYRIEESDEPSVQQRQNAGYHEYLQSIPIVEHWKMYLFQKDELIELKRSF